MRVSLIFSVCALALLPSGLFAQPYLHLPQIAFPGAEGPGRLTTGGRLGNAIVVTNLNDSGPGSLREAIEAEGQRIIVFRVSGTIYLESDLRIENGDLTIAGQSAPGGGITLASYPLKVEAKNVIIRFIRVRVGDLEEQQGAAFECRYSENVIVDHCSFSWSSGGVARISHNKYFTMQWCVLSEPLHDAGQEAEIPGSAGIWGGEQAAFHHNLIAHVAGGAPHLQEASHEEYAEWGDGHVDLRNNVIYNWSHLQEPEGEANADESRPNYSLVGNVYKPGPALSGSTAEHFIHLGPNASGTFGRLYLAGNYLFGAPETSRENWRGVDGVSAEEEAGMRLDEPSVAMRGRPENWHLLHFDRDADGDGFLDVFEDFEGVEIDPFFGTSSLPRFSITEPLLLNQALRSQRVTDFDELSPEVQELLMTYYGYYVEAGAVYSDGTPFVARNFKAPPYPGSSFAVQLRNIGREHTTFPALEAYEQVLAHAGASFPHRDAVDDRVIEDVRNESGSGTDGLIASQEEVGGFPALPSAEAPLDTDGDGMPDEWELARGLDPESHSSSWADGDNDGYTDLEEYLNGLVDDHFQTAYSASYADWVAAAFWDGESESDLMDDPDGDGRVNAMEYALVSDPLLPDASHAEPTVSLPALYSVSYRLGADLDFNIWMGDLNRWLPLWSSASPGALADWYVEGYNGVPWSRAAELRNYQPGIHTGSVQLDFHPRYVHSTPPMDPVFWRFTVSDGWPTDSTIWNDGTVAPIP